MLRNMVRGFHRVVGRSISISTHNVFGMTALPGVSDNFVDDVFVCIVFGLFPCCSSRFRFVRFYVWCLIFLLPYFLTTGRLVQCMISFVCAASGHALCGRRRSYLECRARLLLRFLLALPGYVMVWLFVVAAYNTSRTQRCLQNLPTLSSSVVCQQRQNF